MRRQWFEGESGLVMSQQSAGRSNEYTPSTFEHATEKYGVSAHTSLRTWAFTLLWRILSFSMILMAKMRRESRWMALLTLGDGGDHSGDAGAKGAPGASQKSKNEVSSLHPEHPRQRHVTPRRLEGYSPTARQRRRRERSHSTPSHTDAHRTDGKEPEGHNPFCEAGCTPHEVPQLALDPAAPPKPCDVRRPVRDTGEG